MAQGNSAQLVLRANILGFPLTLIGSYDPGKTLMLVIDGEDPEQQPEEKEKQEGDQEAASELVKKQLTEDPTLLSSFKDSLDESFGTAEAIMSIFKKISLNDIAIKRDLEKKQTLFHLDLRIDLNLKQKSLGLALRFISLDLLMVSGKESMEEESVKAFKIEIAEAKKTARGRVKQLQATASASENLRTMEEALKNSGQSIEQMLEVEKAASVITEQETQLANANESLTENEKALKAYTKKIEDTDKLSSESLTEAAIDQLLNNTDKFSKPTAEEEKELKKLAETDLWK